MMDNSTFEGMSDEARKLFEKEFERATLLVRALKEKIRQELGVGEEKIEFFISRQNKFKEIKK